ncbi:MAG TPA: gamma-glutamyl-gamma-aminobutyrate hydrolase family protein [Nitrospiria bacterium]|nr:gamma-glutamyl-gamma-aminobutyrate hydrolase family protein [Nitrospiria bacterium]
MTEVVAIQHIPCETLGTLADALGAAGISFDVVRTFEGQTVPNTIKGFGGLIILGGPMGVYEQDRYPFLRQEIRLIEEALRQDKPLLGVCLGSQLLAAALGAPVTKGESKEIGWHPISLKPAAMQDPLWAEMGPSFVAYHWHGDVFELPFGAVSLASSEKTPHQAFRYGRSAYGVLFHMEVTERIIKEMVKTFQEELQSENLDGIGIVQQAPKHLPRLGDIGKSVFTRWAGLVGR